MLKKVSSTQTQLFTFTPGDSEHLHKFAATTSDKTSSNLQLHKITKLNSDHIYVRFRAIGSLEIDGPNANFDAFPYGEFEDGRPNYGYKSFEGKRAFIEHSSDDISNSIGDLVASYLNRFNTSKYGYASWRELADDQRVYVLGSRSDAEDGSVEVLMAIDKELSPKVSRMVSTGSPVGCSMGTNIDYSECSVCGSRAYFEHQYCPHIQFSKGSRVFVSASQIHDLIKKGTLKKEWLPWILSREDDRTAVSNNSRRMVHASVFEINYGLSFFELSVVANPAFSRGYKLEKVAATTKCGFRQLIPMVILPEKEVEFRFNVSEAFFNQAINSYATAVQRPYNNWSNQEKVEFLRDADVAKSALSAGAVGDVLVPQIDVPAVKEAGIAVEPSSEPGFYTVNNPESLFDVKYANILISDKVISSKKTGFVRRKKAENYFCSWCKQVYAKNNNELINEKYSVKDFSASSICPSCAEGIVEKEFKNYKHSFSDPSHVLYKNTGKDLFNYRDFEDLVSRGEHPQALVDSLYRAAAVNPPLQLKVDSYIDMLQEHFGDIARRDYTTIEGDIMANSDNNKKDNKKAGYDGLPSTVEDIKDQGIKVEKTEMTEWKDGAKTGSDQIEQEKEARTMGTIFLDAIAAKKGLKDNHTAISTLKDEIQKCLAFAKNLKKADGDFGDDFDRDTNDFFNDEMNDVEVIDEPVVVLENVIEDLQAVVEDLGGVEKDVENEEVEMDEILANRKRWSKQASEVANKVVERSTPVLGDATNAVKFAKASLANIVNTFKKSSKQTGGDVVNDKNGSLNLTKENIESLRQLSDIFRGPKQAADDEKGEEEKEKKEEEKREEEKEKKEAAIGDYPKEVPKKEQKYEQFERTEPKKAEAPVTKEAAAQPPTGARDPGDYGDPGGIESIELKTWWNEMYPEYEKMKSKERSTDFDSPEGRVDLLTGIVAKFIRNPLTAAKSKYAIFKVGENDVPTDGLVVSFEDAAGENMAEETYNAFSSENYFNDLVAAVGSQGVEATLKSLEGGTRLTKAQMEGLTPGKTEKVNPLYDTHEVDKNSGKERSSEYLDAAAGDGGEDKAYYNEAYKDPGYATEMVKKYKLAATASAKEASEVKAELQAYKDKETARVLSQRALQLARKAASRGIIPFDKPNVYAKAREYLNLDDSGFKEVNATLDSLNIVERLALEAYQIPEAENMQRGVAHQTLDAVNEIREEGKSAEELKVDGLQPAVQDNAKLSAEEQTSIRKKAASIVPQLTQDVANQSGANSVPDLSSKFTTIGNALRKKGEYDKYAHFLNRRSQQ